MLRVYCSCPGESMMMKRRCGGLEIAPGDVDGDALLALGLEAVEQQAEIDLLAVDGAVLRGVHDGRALILGDAGAVPQQPADQRRLAVVHRAAGQQAHDGAARDAAGAAGAAQGRRRSLLSAQPHASEITLTLLHLHGAGLIVVDQPPCPLGILGAQHLLHHRVEVARVGLDRRGERPAAERAEADVAQSPASRRARAACARRRP